LRDRQFIFYILNFYIQAFFGLVVYFLAEHTINACSGNDGQGQANGQDKPIQPSQRAARFE
jgi:hypothetical protein